MNDEPRYRINLDAAHKDWEGVRGDGGTVTTSVVDYLFKLAFASRAYFNALTAFASDDTVAASLDVNITELTLAELLAQDTSRLRR